MKPKSDSDHSLHHNMVFDTAGFCGAMGAVRGALIEIPVSRIVFATDDPQEIRDRAALREFVAGLRTLRKDLAVILNGTLDEQLKQRVKAPARGHGTYT